MWYRGQRILQTNEQSKVCFANKFLVKFFHIVLTQVSIRYQANDFQHSVMQQLSKYLNVNPPN